MTEVFTKPLERQSGNNNKEFFEESAKIIGNKQVKIKVGKTFPDGSNVYNPRITNPVISSQTDELGNPISIFEISGNNTLKLKAGETISNIISIEYNDTFLIRRNSGSAGGGDSADKFSVLELEVDGSNNVIGTFEILSAIGDNRDIAVNDSFTIPKYFKSSLDKNTRDENDQFAWKIEDLGATEIQLKEWNTNLKITYYDPNAIGGN